MILRIIKYMLTRLKMLLDRFFLNTDHDTLKERSVLGLEINVPAFIIGATSPDRVKNFEVTSEESYPVSFESPAITSTFFPDAALVGDDTIYDNGEIECAFFVSKLSGNRYKFRVRMLNYSGHDIQVPDTTFTARIHMFVPSSQDN